MAILVELPTAPWELALATVAIFAGAAVQGAVGFGLSLVAAPVLLLIDPRFVPGPLLALSIFLTLLMLAREPRHLALRDLGPVMLGRIPGTLTGLWLLLALAPRQMELTFGIMLLLAVAMSATRRIIEPTQRALVAAGVCSGVMSMTTSAGGPPLAIVYQGSDGAKLRATLSGHFLLGASVSLIALRGGGRLGYDEAVLCTILLPGLAAGFLASSRFRHRLDAGLTRTAVLAVSASAAIAVIIRALTA